MKVLATVVAVIATGLGASACGEARHVTVRPAGRALSVAARVVRSSRLVRGRHIRISATVSTPVQAGSALKVRFSIRNVSKQPRRIELGYASLWLVVHGADGARYDTRVPLRGAFGPFVPATKLRPGEAVTRNIPYLRVRWSGPVRITPGWARDALPSLRVGVSTPPGPLPTGKAAVAEVTAATGHLLDDCHPKDPGVAVTGRIDAPKSSAPSMRARCLVSLHREHGFWVAQVLVVTRPAPRGAHLIGTYERFTWPHPGRNAEAIGWEFVVTRAGATSVDSTSVESTKRGKRMAPDWQWTTSGWQDHPGGSRCGGTGGGGGGYIGPLVEFVSVCPS
jgi:hypothetical protein